MSFRIRWGSIRNKIIVWAFVPAAFILLAVALFSLYAYRSVTERLVIERDRELTRLSAQLLGSELAAYADPLSKQFLDVFDSGIVVFDANKKVLAAEPEQIEGWGLHWERRIPFRRMLSDSGFVFSDVVSGASDQEQILVAVVPVIGREGIPVGWVAGVFRLQPTPGNVLYEHIERLRRGESNCIYLVDGSGQVIYHSRTEYIGTDFSSQPVVQQVILGTWGAFRTRDLEGHEIVASFAPVPGTSWGLVTEESWEALIRPSRRYEQWLVLLLALGVVVPVGIVTVGLRQIMDPIRRLREAASQVAEGNFRQQITVATGDELEELSGQFNRMALQLQSSYDDLERRVANRTRELAALNRLAAVVSRSLDLHEIMQDALDEAMAIMEMEKGEAFVLDQETQRLTLVAHRGLGEELIRYTARLPLHASTAGLAAQEGRPAYRLVKDYPPGRLKDLVQQEGCEMVVSVPLLVKEKTVGAIDLGASKARTIEPEELSLLSAIGHQIGVAVENARLYEQAQQLAVVQERNRLARDLHDSVMQALYGVTLYAEAAMRQLSAGDQALAQDHLGEIRDTAGEALREMRVLIFELRPSVLQREGLVAALRSRLEAVEGRVGIMAQFEAECPERLTAEVEEELYRVALEALNNALRHAHADSVCVRLYQDCDGIRLEIVDDGIGFDPDAARGYGGFGLRSMHERVSHLGGTLTLSSQPGKGTTVKVEVRQ